MERQLVDDGVHHCRDDYSVVCDETYSDWTGWSSGLTQVRTATLDNKSYSPADPHQAGGGQADRPGTEYRRLR